MSPKWSLIFRLLTEILKHLSFTDCMLHIVPNSSFLSYLNIWQTL